MNSISVQVYEIAAAGSIDVSEANIALVELVGKIEPGRMVHCYLRAKACVAEIRPVTNFAVAHPYQIGETITRHVGEIDGLSAVSEHQSGTRFLVERLGYPLTMGESVLRQ